MQESNETLVDAIVRRVKNQPVAAWAIVGLFAVVGLGQLTGSLNSISQFVRAHPVGRDSSPTAAPSADVILGIWEHYDKLDGPNWSSVSRIVVTKDQNGFSITPVQQTEDSLITPSFGIFDIQSDGKSWSFKSVWSGADTGQFELKLVTHDLFEGESYSMKGHLGRGRGPVRFHRIK